MSYGSPTAEEKRAVRYRQCPRCGSAPGRWCIVVGLGDLDGSVADLIHKARLLADNEPAVGVTAPVAESIQLALLLGPLDHAVVGETIQERFESFHELNAWVYEALETLTQDWLDRGRTRIGIKMLFEILRWQYGRQTTGSDFKLDNNMTSRYARLLIENHPEWSAVFQTRELKSA